MKKSLFGLIDRIELLSCYIFCFAFNIMLDYIKTLSIDSYLLKSFLKQLYDYQSLIILLLTFIVVIFHYQLLNRKKKEVYCRILVGDTVWYATIRYIFECLAILGIVFVISIIINIMLNININDNLYLSGVFVVYILITSRMVSRFESF
ncbi:hypothetical protein [Mediterraneibacter gnavus]|uniref:hypothetical protein n=1 Tax=Mediterraneibacter gnavus TaxID=33038 RepID=UPI0015D4341F|nr:hypothetical protein [Mediterraneibacter gnavus]